MRSRIAREDGGTTVEFAVVLVVFLTFLFGIMDFSRALYVYHFVCEVAREGSRYAMVRGSTYGASCATVATASCAATDANVTSYIRSKVPLAIQSSSVSVTTTWPGTAPAGATGACNTTNGINSPGCLVQVQVSYPFRFILPFLPSATTTLQSTSVMVIAQ